MRRKEWRGDHAVLALRSNLMVYCLYSLQIQVCAPAKREKTEAQENDFAAKPSSAAMRNSAFLSFKSFSNARVFFQTSEKRKGRYGSNRIRHYPFCFSLIKNCSAVLPEYPPSSLCQIRASRSNCSSTGIPSRSAMARTIFKYSFWSGEG